jgi:hypothetical protein
MVLLPTLALGRILPIMESKALIADAKLVFVGRVKSVMPSNIRTTLSYVPYDGVTFQWQIGEVEVVEPFKGVRKGDVVQVAMLSIDKRSRSQTMYSPPGMLEPQQGDIFFLCLGATPQTNVFAALLAPYDENLSVLPLYRSRTNMDDEDNFMKKLLSDDLKNDIKDRDLEKQIKSRAKQFSLIYSLVGTSGKIQPPNVKKFRETFATDIGKAPSTNVVYLEWETHTNPHGWRSDAPKVYEATTNINGR